MRNKFNLNTLSLHNNLQQSIPILTTIFTLPFFLQLKCPLTSTLQGNQDSLLANGQSQPKGMLCSFK